LILLHRCWRSQQPCGRATPSGQCDRRALCWPLPLSDAHLAALSASTGRDAARTAAGISIGASRQARWDARHRVGCLRHRARPPHSAIDLPSSRFVFPRILCSVVQRTPSKPRKCEFPRITAIVERHWAAQQAVFRRPRPYPRTSSRRAARQAVNSPRTRRQRRNVRGKMRVHTCLIRRFTSITQPVYHLARYRRSSRLAHHA